MTVTLAIVIITCLISIPAFRSQKMIDDLIFSPPAVTERNQWYRFITCGFIHADIPHLLFNMYALYMFGGIVEDAFMQVYGTWGKVIFVVMYLTTLVACLLPTYLKHKDDYYYRSLGASGAISAIVFSFIFLYPMQGIGLLFIPIPLPGFVFGIIYLIITSVLAKRGGSHINHSAHLWGALYGIAFLIVTSFAFTQYNLINAFTQQVQAYIQSF